MKSISMVIRLRLRLKSLVDSLSELVTALPICRSERNAPGIVIIAPEFYFGEFSDTQRAAQIELKRSYELLYAYLKLILRQAPEDLIQQVEDINKQFRVWLELGHNWSLTGDPKRNVVALKSVEREFETVLSVLENIGSGKTIIIPDTNSLIIQPDPTVYRTIAGSSEFIFMLLPTVLGELDHLQREHKNPELRNKAKKAITRIKGWRAQGALSNGVKVDGTITVQALYSEPDMKQTLSWLDEGVFDDRILAAALELLSAHPAARIVLVTGDINLQNKSDAAMIETAEIPDIDEASDAAS